VVARPSSVPATYLLYQSAKPVPCWSAAGLHLNTADIVSGGNTAKPVEELALEHVETAEDVFRLKADRVRGAGLPSADVDGERSSHAHVRNRIDEAAFAEPHNMRKGFRVAVTSVPSESKHLCVGLSPIKVRRKKDHRHGFRATVEGLGKTHPSLPI
jgi:hypothetical protein